MRGRMKLRGRKYRVGECGLVREGLMAGSWGRSNCVPRSLLRVGHTETRPDPQANPQRSEGHHFTDTPPNVEVFDVFDDHLYLKCVAFLKLIHRFWW